MINSVEATKNDKSYNDKKSAGGGGIQPVNVSVILTP